MVQVNDLGIDAERARGRLGHVYHVRRVITLTSVPALRFRLERHPVMAQWHSHEGAHSRARRLVRSPSKGRCRAAWLEEITGSSSSIAAISSLGIVRVRRHHDFEAAHMGEEHLGTLRVRSGRANAPQGMRTVTGR